MNNLTRSIAALIALLHIAPTAAAPLDLSNQPLQFSQGPEPNVMILFDNSGSMDNIMWDEGFDPTITYPIWGNVQPTGQYFLYHACYTAQRNQGGQQKQICIPGPAGSNNTRYLGNYFNFIFETYPNNSDLRNGPIPTNTRLQVAKQVATSIVNANSNLRLGLARFNPPGGNESSGAPGGTVVANCGTSAASLISTINGFSANSNTPLAETFYEVTRYFRGISRYFSNGTHTSPIQYRCQKNFVVVITDGFPTWDTQIPNNDPADIAIAGKALPNWDGLAPATSSATFPIFPQHSDGYAPDDSPTTGEGRTLFLDDLALFGNEIDLKASPLVDNDGVGYDAADFPQQNIVTYTVGFTLANQMLVDAAEYGDGTAYFANTADQLSVSLQAAFNDIQSRGTTSGSSAGSVRSSVIAGGFLYQTVGNPDGWSGKLLSRPISTGKQTNDPKQPNHANCIIGPNDPDYPNLPLGGPLPVGEPCPPVWDAATAVNGQNWGSRTIITRRSDLGLPADPAASGLPVAFRWGNAHISGNQRDMLHKDTLANQSNDTLGQARLQYIRGRSDNNAFRSRTTVLGDIINSGAQFVGAPAFGYDFGDYAAFKSSYSTRNGIVYAGANDGMLHAFKAVNGSTKAELSGEELFAYIPGDRFVWNNLNKLTHPDYKETNHRFFVDGQTTYVDAQVNGSWASLLAGGLGNGGQTVYLLDVTEASVEATEAATATKKLLWEFSDLDDPDLGFTHSTPSIARMANGKWAVIIGNGYNNSDDDTNYGTTVNSKSNNGNAHIFILYVDGPGIDGVWNLGTDYIKLSATGGSVATPNGMATPIAVDTNADAKVDYLYAGDLLGQLWRFDIRDASDSNWNNASKRQKIFEARNASSDIQSITSRPEVVAHPDGVHVGVVVLFGTGRYLDETVDVDVSSYPTQSFYGIWDPLPDNISASGNAYTAPVRGSDLVQQEILDEVQFVTQVSNYGTTTNCTGGQNCFRILTENPVTLSAANKRGWYIDLYNTNLGSTTDNFGERVITNPLVRGDRVVFTTLLPNDASKLCSSSSDGWLMELDMYSGGAPTEPVFDANDDDSVDDSDHLKIDIDNAPYISAPGGIKFDEKNGMLPSPTIVVDPLTNTEKKCFPRNNGLMTCILEAGPSDGRLSWREIH